MHDELGVEPVQPVQIVPRRRTVVTALPLKKAAHLRLSQLLNARVLDMREQVDDVDMVLCPSCSPQLIGALKRMYAGARVVIVELDDWDLDIDLGGPVKRLLRAGADAYVLAESLEELAVKIGESKTDTDEHDDSNTDVSELTTGSTVDEIIAAFLRESIEYSTRVHTSR